MGFSRELISQHPDELGPDGIDQVSRIATAGQRTGMGALIDALLHMSRLSQAPMQLRVVNISAFATDIAIQLMDA